MKQQKIFLTSLSLITIVAMFVLIGMKFTQISPVAVATPDKTQPIESSELSSKSKADQPATDSTPTINVPRQDPVQPKATGPVVNAPKQEEIRQSVSNEHLYYPLLTANDPGYATNWAIQKVNAPAAWDISTGNGSTVVAVIDTGFSLNHEDLKNNWYTNPGETGNTTSGGICWTGVALDKSINNCDDDSNGYVDDWRGWNFAIGDNNPQTGRSNPNGNAVSHGTETSGLVGSAGNNSTGITTINWNTKIMPLQGLTDDGPGYTSDIVAAIYYAVDNGASVINMSLGGSDYDPAMKTAVDYAYANNVVVVAAAGNCGTGTESGCTGLGAGYMGYPAVLNHVISVGATTSSDSRASFSSYGPGLDVVAPGSGSINSPTWTPTNATTLYSSALYGTSFASPQVASLASLIKAIRPSSSVDDIAALISATATKVSSMSGSPYANEYGHGIINAGKALQVAQSLNSTSATPTLLQAGSSKSEHSYTSSTTLGSGCKAAVASYCTVWMHDNISGNDRYLPYTQADAGGKSGWTWSGSIIPTGDWQVRAMQGDFLSPIYFLGGK